MPLSAAPVGVGFKPQHLADILNDDDAIDFFEVHAENYMGAGGPPHRHLEALRERFALSIHGVGLSIGAERGLDPQHLARLKNLIARHPPVLFSEHLAWSSHGEEYLNDLLPLPYTQATLDLVCAHIDQVQDTLGRRLLLENPSTYVLFDESTISETQFLREIVRRTGCGLLLDVNNVYVSAINHGFDPKVYLADFPLQAVGEIHLAGHAVTQDEAGAPLLIDAHDSPVIDQVWELYKSIIARRGPVPTLIEWDNDVPDWLVLKAESAQAKAIMQALPHVAAA